MSPDEQRRTFLSYSRINKDFALKLAKELKAEGFDVWVDQLDIPLGARWDREVEKALRESDIFMIILTSASVDSENVLDEIGYAIDTHKRFLPILLEECDVPLRLRRFQYVDFTNKSFEDGVDAAKGLLRGLIAQHTVPRKEAAPDTQVEADRKAREKAKQLAKAEADRAREEDKRKAKAKEGATLFETVSTKTKEETVSAISASKKPTSRSLIYGIGAVVVLVIVGVVFSVISKGGNKNVPVSTPMTQVYTSAPSAIKTSTTPTKVISTNTVMVVPTPTLGISRSSVSQNGTFRVSSSLGWQPTGIMIEKGSTVQFEVINGVWSSNELVTGFSNTGDGTGVKCIDVKSSDQCSEPLPSYFTGGLIGQIGNQVFGVGKAIQVKSQEQGELSLRMNDNTLDDNAGTLLVQITIIK